jgi:homoserine dehydrogenase
MSQPATLTKSAPVTAAPIVVLKFGSSVLVDRTSLPEVVSEIYRIVRTGRRVIAVTSAFHGVTDQLIAETQITGCLHDNVNAPAYIATGEEQSAALVALACDRSGLCATVLKTAELGLIAHGPALDSTPVRLDDTALRNALAHFDVVVVPGFVASDESGRTVLLGRGGSDLTAVYLAHAMDAERIRLVKDVDGVYDHDPAKDAKALRYDAIDWASARDVAGKLVQARALSFAEAHRRPVEVGAIGHDDVTVVADTFVEATRRPPRKRLRVALGGYGVVGAGLAARLRQRPEDFEITGVLVRDAARTREGDLDPSLFTTDAEVLLASKPDVVVDALSSGPAGLALSETALRAGIHVVSANKQAVIAGHQTLNTARGDATLLLYSAAVGGGAPLLEAVATARSAGAGIARIEGVLNGTVGFLLNSLADGATFDDALAAARVAGLAEEDPSADLTGADAIAKLRLVSIAAFGAAPRVTDIEAQALDADRAAAAGNQRLQQVVRIEQTSDGVRGAVRFEPCESGPFPHLRGDRNAIRVIATDGRVWTAQGRGAGRWPTTESLFADLCDLNAARRLDRA